MNPRERILLGCVVAVLVLAGGWSVVQWGFISRWDAAERDLDRAAERVEKLQRQLRLSETAEQRWAELTPIAHNVELAQGLFRQDVTQMLATNGLGEECTIRKLPARKIKSANDVDFTEVRLSVQTRGALRELLNFQRDFYQRDYPARLDQVSLTAENTGRRTRTAGRGRPGREAAAEEAEPRLNMTMTLSALVLPQIKNARQQGTADLQPLPRDDEPGRLPRPTVDYELVVEHNLFEEWKPAAEIVVAQPVTTERPRPNPGPTPLPPAPSPPPPERILLGVTSIRGKPAVYVRDQDRLDVAPDRVYINQELHDGTLVLVDTRGMVVQVPEDTEDGTEYRYYFYELGETFSEREELDPQAHPDIVRRLEETLDPAPRISSVAP